MPSSWNVYYVVFLSALLALAIPFALAMISSAVSPPSNRKPLRQEVLDQVAPANETSIGKRINTRFFLGMNAALVLIALMLILIPCVGMLRDGVGANGKFRALIAIVSISSFALLGLLYAVKKGDLSWLTSFQRESERRFK